MALARVLRPVLQEYDYILIDCQPSLGLLAINALTVAHGVLIPLECEFFSLRGVALLLDTIDKVRERLNFDLELEGILATMYDSRTTHCRQVLQRVVEAFGDKVYQTVITKTVKFPESTVAGAPITTLDPASSGARNYRQLAREVIAAQDERGLALARAVLWALAQPAAMAGLLGRVRCSASACARRRHAVDRPRLGLDAGRGAVRPDPREDIDPLGAVAACLGGTGWGRPSTSTRCPGAAAGSAWAVSPPARSRVLVASQLAFVAYQPRLPRHGPAAAPATARPTCCAARYAPTLAGAAACSRSAVGLLCFGLLALLPVPPFDGLPA